VIAPHAAVRHVVEIATLLSRLRRYGRHSGIRHSGSSSDARPRSARRQAPRRCRIAPATRTQRDSRAPVNVAMSTIIAGFSRAARRAHRTGSAAPRLGIADLDGEPLRVRTMSRGRIALPETAFSTHGISTRSRTFRPPSRSPAEREHDRRTGHVLLHVEHARGGLEVEPARIETHALPTSVTFGAISSPKRCRQARRPRAGRPTAWIVG